METQTLLALYRTRLAELRSATALLQFGLVLVTLPLTIHAGLMILAQQHPGAARFHHLLPLWLVLVALLLTGVVVTVVAARMLVRALRSCRALRRHVSEGLPDEAAGPP